MHDHPLEQQIHSSPNRITTITTVVIILLLMISLSQVVSLDRRSLCRVSNSLKAQLTTTINRQWKKNKEMMVKYSHNKASRVMYLVLRTIILLVHQQQRILHHKIYLLRTRCCSHY